MTLPGGRAPSRFARIRTLVGAVGVSVVLVAGMSSGSAAPRLAAAQASAPTTVAAKVGELPPLAPGSIRITQANLLSGQPDGNFLSDVTTVMAGQPDFITYNEVPYRPDTTLAPPGYALFRTPGKYTGATPVAWRTDKWTAIAQGTTMLSDKKGRLPGQSVDWGIRYANWVTLQGIDGHVLSVVSVHLPPKASNTVGLAALGIQRLGDLAATLSVSGPVLAAGDFNMHYTSTDYQRDLFTQYGFTPTYDVTGTYLPTGDHQGATIDYVFMNQASQFVVQGQYTTELFSDHDAVTADLAFTGAPTTTVPSIPEGTVVNSPSGNKDERRAVLDLMVRAVNDMDKKAAVHLTTRQLSDKRLTNALVQAKERGVHVQLVTRNPKPNAKERKLFAALGTKVVKKSWAVTCGAICQRMDSKGKIPSTRLLISASGNTKAIRIDSDQAAVFSSTRALTTATVTTSKGKYDGAFKRFFLLVGRTI